jgi:hypothetical protein
MTVDSQLLEKARNAGALLEEAERRALLCRADYHVAVRRLHLAGGSLREIAHSLSLSHQRVQQIVAGAGGSWWSRVWRSRAVRPDVVCTWCGRPPAEVDKLIAGPRVYICGDCVAAAENVAAGGPSAGGFDHVRTRTAAIRCVFCGHRAGKERRIVTAPAGHVCTDCLRISREILEGRAG